MVASLATAPQNIHGMFSQRCLYVTSNSNASVRSGLPSRFNDPSACGVRNELLKVILLNLIFAAIGLLRTEAPAVAGGASLKDCSSLMQERFNGTLDAPTQITTAEVAAEGKTKHRYCQVTGYVAPNVGFLLSLPLDYWNGKFLEHGCGGFCGGNLAEDVKQLPEFFLDPLRRGYAVLIFDGGHQVSGASGLWAYNNLQAQFDFGIRAPHVSALAGKAIIERYYEMAPSRSYFFGCSSGGQQALSEAQRFPWDFDGIIAGAPSPTFSGPMMYYLWAARALIGTVTKADLNVVHKGAVAKCDMDDGVEDGVIGDPLHCRFDPGTLRCEGKKQSSCLTDTQVEAVRKVYSGPVTSNGKTIYSGGPLPGSELNWMTDEPSAAYVIGGQAAPWPKEYFSYVGFMPAPGATWSPSEFNFDRDYKRLRMAESLFGAADNPDLRKFKAAGGKLILYQGGQDESDIPTDAIDYYETAEKTMGGRSETQEFLRLFLVPGMNHCTGGPGAYAIDYLDSLERWVERGQAPDKLIGAHVASTDPAEAYRLSFPLAPTVPVTFTRPFFPFPVLAKYTGRGNPNDAASFVPVTP